MKWSLKFEDVLPNTQRVLQNTVEKAIYPLCVCVSNSGNDLDCSM